MRELYICASKHLFRLTCIFNLLIACISGCELKDVNYFSISASCSAHYAIKAVSKSRLRIDALRRRCGGSTFCHKVKTTKPNCTKTLRFSFQLKELQGKNCKGSSFQDSECAYLASFTACVPT